MKKNILIHRIERFELKILETGYKKSFDVYFKKTRQGNIKYQLVIKPQTEYKNKPRLIFSTLVSSLDKLSELEDKLLKILKESRFVNGVYSAHTIIPPNTITKYREHNQSITNKKDIRWTISSSKELKELKEVYEA